MKSENYEREWGEDKRSAGARERFGPFRPPTRMAKATGFDQMLERHREIARLVAMGYKNVQIAEEVGVTPQQVCNVRNSPVVQQHVGMLQGKEDKETMDIHARIRDFAPKCLSVLEEIVEDDELPALQKRKTAMDYLGLAGIVAPKNVNMKSLNVHAGPEVLDRVKERALAALGDMVVED